MATALKAITISLIPLKTLKDKSVQSSAGTSALMQLSISECRELRDLLLLDPQDIPSSPTPLLEALEAIAANSDSEGSDTLDPSQDAAVTPTPIGLPNHSICSDWNFRRSFVNLAVNEQN